ncbi:MAG: DUF4469 domain-containing protein [Tannerella sp.]|jgi:hypothetical protein|nr:DUF4469 domain-containing protein [Tannerella sp.]
MINYVLEENLLTPNKPNDRCARVVNVHSYSENDLAEAVARRNIGISKAEALAMLEATAEIKLQWLKEGHAINMRLAHYHPSIPGTYEEGEYPKEAAIRITPSKEVTELAKSIPLQQVEPVSPIRIEFVDDTKSGTTNSRITGGGVVKIVGHHLKVAGIDPAVGVKFVNADNPAIVYPVPADEILINNPSELMVLAPVMTSGEEVLLRIVTQYSSGKKELNVPRSVTFEKRLTII